MGLITAFESVRALPAKVTASVSNITTNAKQLASKIALGTAITAGAMGLPANDANADIVLEIDGITTESSEITFGTIFNFKAIVDENTPDDFDFSPGLGGFDNPFKSFELRIGNGVDQVLVQGSGGSVMIAPVSNTATLSIQPDDIISISGLPSRYSPPDLGISFSNLDLQGNDSLINGLYGLVPDTSIGTFRSDLYPTSARGPISYVSVSATSVPEPSSLVLTTLALGGAAAASRRRRQAPTLEAA